MYNLRSDDLFGFNIILQKRMQNKSNIRIISTENEHNIIKITNMKKQKLSMLFLGILSVGMTLQSCDDDDNYYYYYPINRPNAIVTVKPETAESKFFLQLDDSTTLTPLNMNSSPYGSKEVRAFINFRYAEQQNNKRNFNVYVNWMDSILTKPTAENLGTEENVKKYGQDPVEIGTSDWVTIAEDGYLTLSFKTKWSSQRPHYVNLVTGENPDNPYEVTFYHNADGDVNGYWGYGIVAFKLDKLPDTEGKTVDLTLKWKSYNGDRKVTFKYCTRKSSTASAKAVVSPSEYMKCLK